MGGAADAEVCIITVLPPERQQSVFGGAYGSVFQPGKRNMGLAEHSGRRGGAVTAVASSVSAGGYPGPSHGRTVLYGGQVRSRAGKRPPKTLCCRSGGKTVIIHTSASAPCPPIAGFAAPPPDPGGRYQSGGPAAGSGTGDLPGSGQPFGGGSGRLGPVLHHFPQVQDNPGFSHAGGGPRTNSLSSTSTA